MPGPRVWLRRPRVEKTEPEDTGPGAAMGGRVQPECLSPFQSLMACELKMISMFVKGCLKTNKKTCNRILGGSLILKCLFGPLCKGLVCTLAFGRIHKNLVPIKGRSYFFFSLPFCTISFFSLYASSTYYIYICNFLYEKQIPASGNN